MSPTQLFSRGALAIALSALPALAWTPGPGSADHSSGFTVDTSNRDDVVSFWHHVYKASSDFRDRAVWTGTLSENENECVPGTNNQALHIDTERRINFFRAMVGVPATLKIVNDDFVFTKDLKASSSYTADLPAADVTRGEAAMYAAMMTALRQGPNHSPGPSEPCFSPAAYNGAFLSSLTYGLWGPESIDGYMLEPDFIADNPLDSVLNVKVGHRRWVMYPGARTYASANIPKVDLGTRETREVNALYHFGDLDTTPHKKFVAYPNAGFFPKQLLPTRWSLTYPRAIFKGATVKVFDGEGKEMEVIVDHRSDEQLFIGDKTLSWRIENLPKAEELTKDTTFRVEVTGIGGDGVPTSHSYSVTVMDPEKTIEPLAIAGSTTPNANGANLYLAGARQLDKITARLQGVTPVSNDEQSGSAITQGFLLDKSAPGVDLSDLPDPNPGVEAGWWPQFVNTSTQQPLYNLTFAPAANTEETQNGGTRFRPADPTASYLEFDGVFQGTDEAVIELKYRRGYMSPSTHFEVQYLPEGETQWRALEPSIVKGTNAPDLTTSAQSTSFAFLKTPARIRLAYRYLFDGQSLFSSVFKFNAQGEFGFIDMPTGIYINDISFKGFEKITELGELTANTSANQFKFERGSANFEAGKTYYIRATGSVNDFTFPTTERFRYTVVGGSQATVFDGTFEGWKKNNFAIIGDRNGDFDRDGQSNLLEFAFGTNPVEPGPARSATPSTTPETGVKDGKFELCRALPNVNPLLEYEAAFTDDLSKPIDQWSTIPATFSNGCLRASIDIGQNDGLYVVWLIKDPLAELDPN